MPSMTSHFLSVQGRLEQATGVSLPWPLFSVSLPSHFLSFFPKEQGLWKAFFFLCGPSNWPWQRACSEEHRTPLSAGLGLSTESGEREPRSPPSVARTSGRAFWTKFMAFSPTVGFIQVSAESLLYLGAVLDAASQGQRLSRLWSHINAQSHPERQGTVLWEGRGQGR